MNGDDALSERLIAQLLQEDLLLAESTKQAERLQLDQVLAASSRSKGRIPKYSSAVVTDSPKYDSEIALEILAADAMVSCDATYATSLQHAQRSALVADEQYAQRVAAAERKIELDAEFAKRLQAMDHDGEEDVDTMKDVERLGSSSI